MVPVPVMVPGVLGLSIARLPYGALYDEFIVVMYLDCLSVEGGNTTGVAELTY